MRALLVGGPFDGQERDLDPARKLLTIEWTDTSLAERVRRDRWRDAGFDVEPTQINFATYERHPDGTFHYAPGHPSEVGDEQRWDQLMLPPTDEEGKGYG